ncbi:SDR family NAD(P)-dependent oxidoreductase [Nitratifractor salsuginis]|uniref:Short-chain dehydrogenase/reductase SDR n=1 Tax=Nitratifractor salsuginis (strain DSM 16511 / JCM 12458 / E9I37-1) TaxID=749222 RepID=E6X2J3_NITSE|nr:SDR family NAD(P)-dependent oxidoreductase [Nitratifractor salsuginis]ADV47198.1 short-chain dehydrogenase/reductase SDR [Nitratifractor salsuginis DSM 16511]
MRKVLITGVSTGLGAALAEALLRRGDAVYAIGQHENRAFANRPGYYFLPADLSDVEMIPENIKAFIDRHNFDLAILNAGILGDIREMDQFTLPEIREVMDLNVWANKQIIDTLDRHARPKQVVAVSSGAAVNGSKGWGPYSISKAALNMMIKVYAAEKPWTHYSAIAPGVVLTPMLEKILHREDEKEFPSIRRIKDGPILRPETAAERFLTACEAALRHPSGTFLDVRKMDL